MFTANDPRLFLSASEKTCRIIANLLQTDNHAPRFSKLADDFKAALNAPTSDRQHYADEVSEMAGMLTRELFEANGFPNNLPIAKLACASMTIADISSGTTGQDWRDIDPKKDASAAFTLTWDGVVAGVVEDRKNDFTVKEWRAFAESNAIDGQPIPSWEEMKTRTRGDDGKLRWPVQPYGTPLTAPRIDGGMPFNPPMTTATDDMVAAFSKLVSGFDPERPDWNALRERLLTVHPRTTREWEKMTIADLAELALRVRRPSNQRKRRQMKPRPLTAKQLHAVEVFGKSECNYSKASRELGLSRTATKDRIRAAYTKLGQQVPTKAKTEALRTDRRGAVDLASGAKPEARGDGKARMGDRRKD